MSVCSKLPLDVFRPMFNPDTFHSLYCDNGTNYYVHPEAKFLRCCKPSGWRPWSDDRPYTKEQRKREIERLAIWCQD